MVKKLNFNAPYILLVLHTVLILLSMFCLSQRWFLTPLPYDCVYLPFLIVSGPIVYFVAHYVQHASEIFFNTDQVMIAWNVLPGMICLVLGGIQWYFIGCYLLKISKAHRPLNLP